jgi:O-antigen/teichoic acid export membrane protein
LAGGETHHERVNRELIELLNELRVVLPGVQVLFAFLLSLPFLTRFDQLTTTQRDVYFVSFICAAAAIALLITPSAYHRLRFRQHDKERMLFTSNRLVIAGTVFLAISLVGVIFVVTDVLYRSTFAAVVTALMSGWFAWFWYGLPLSRRLIDEDAGREGRDDASP